MCAKMNGGFSDIIRFDDKSFLIQKWTPGNGSKRENSIRFGSSLRVDPQSVAVFVYKQKDGNTIEYIEGPHDETLKTKNLPIISSIVGLAYAGGSPFQAEVYFLNLIQMNKLKFGIPFFDVYDAKFHEFAVPIAVRGSFNFKITDYKEFIKLNGLQNMKIDDFKDQISSALTRYVKAVVTNLPSDHDMPVVHLEKKISEINDIVEAKIKERLFNEFGVTVSNLDIDTIEVDKSSDDYKKLLKVTKKLTGRKVKTKANVEVVNESLNVFEKIGNIVTNVATALNPRKKGKK